jgi:hypothetical protein
MITFLSPFLSDNDFIYGIMRVFSKEETCLYRQSIALRRFTGIYWNILIGGVMYILSIASYIIWKTEVLDCDLNG